MVFERHSHHCDRTGGINFCDLRITAEHYTVTLHRETSLVQYWLSHDQHMMFSVSILQ